MHVDLPARLLINSFYAYSMNVKGLTRKNGLEMLALLEAKQVHGDKK
jgi:type III secretory pathway lipoprotein EscJ